MTELLDNIEDYWTLRSESYSEQNMEEMNSWKREAWRKKILSMAPEGECLRILDIGTGPGFFAINLALAGHEVTAVDVTEEMLVHARKNAAAYGATVHFECHNGDTLPFEDNSFDLIVNRNVIWNLERPEQAFAEWKRVLKPGGRIVYFDANWYLYLFDEKMATKKREAKELLRERLPESKSHMEKIPEKKVQMLEDVARELPMSKVFRPEWDKNVLTEMGMKICEIQMDIAADVLNERETLEYAGSPMFMVCSEKVGGEDQAIYY